MAKSICGGTTYQLGGPKEDTIGLPVSLANLPAEIEVEGYKLLRRTSFHVSLVCVGKIAEKHGIQIPEFLESVVADFCKFVKANPVALLRYRNEFRFVTQNERRSVVAMCDISNLDKFFALINQKYGLNVEYPPTHVTLYTLEPDKGIFLTDSRDIEEFTKPIINPGLALP